MTIRIPATAFWCDAVKRSADPTGTLDIRKKFGSLCEQRFRKVRGVLQQSIVDRDVLGLNPASMSPIAMAGSPGNKEIAFQTWLDNLLKKVVVEDGAWMRPMLALSYVRAVSRAQRLTHSSAAPHDKTETIDVLATLALTELQGICEAVSQSIMRSTLTGWLHNMRPPEVFTQVSNAISTIGINRAKSMAALMTVKAFTTGTLDTFLAAGVKQVGLIPEQLKTPKKVGDAYSTNFGFSGPGSRSSRENLPSASTIYRITQNEQNIEADLEAEGDFIEVQTAGDDYVCPECDDIESNNPYTIDEARSLIPAHPNCRCAFVPVDDGSGGGFLGMISSFFGSFFNSKTVFDMNENHDPKTGQFAEGNGGGGGHGGVRSSGNSIVVLGPKAKVAEVKNGLSLLPQAHVDKFPGSIVFVKGGIAGHPDAVGLFRASENKIELGSGFKQIEETMLHEMGHAFDYNSARGADGLSPSMKLFRDIHTDSGGMTAKESAAAQYWLKSSIEAYAETYALSFSRFRDTKPAVFFGGMSRGRALSVFKNSVQRIRSDT